KDQIWTALENVFTGFPSLLPNPFDPSTGGGIQGILDGAKESVEGILESMGLPSGLLSADGLINQEIA
ncbi:MAG: hypothetical protein IJ131_05475, partial [Eggerthellaceae bacterium]|nr:hypothetical protein [Eggerthellaceae bacterium]